MQIPQPSIPSTIIKVSTVSTGVHELIGLSWRVLVPYTVFGLLLVIYGQVRLMIGSHEMQSYINSVPRSRLKKQKKFNKLGNRLHYILFVDPVDLTTVD